MILKRISESTGIVNLKLITPKGPKHPRSPKQPTLRELIVEIRDRLDNLDSRVAKIESRLDKLEETNNVQRKLNEKFMDYMDKHH